MLIIEDEREGCSLFFQDADESVRDAWRHEVE